MKGTKLISDILIDQKIPAHLKRRQQVLISNGDVLAVLGLKTSEKLRFQDKISQALKIVYGFNPNYLHKSNSMQTRPAS